MIELKLKCGKHRLCKRDYTVAFHLFTVNKRCMSSSRTEGDGGGGVRAVGQVSGWRKRKKKPAERIKVIPKCWTTLAAGNAYAAGSLEEPLHTHTHTRLHTRINSNKSVGRKVFFWGDFFPPPGHLQTNGSADSYRFSSPPFHLIRPLLAEEWTLNQVHPHFLFVVDEWTSRDLHVSSSPDFMESIQTLPHLLMQTNKNSFFFPSDFGTNKCGEVSTLALQQPSNSTSLSGSWPWQMIGKTLTRWSVEMWETICPPSSNSAQLQPPPNNKNEKSEDLNIQKRAGTFTDKMRNFPHVNWPVPRKCKFAPDIRTKKKKSLQNYHVTDNFGGGHFLNEKMLMASVRLKRFPSFSAARLIFWTKTTKIKNKKKRDEEEES